MLAFRRALSLVLCVLGAVLNVAVASQLISLWRLLKWETDSEWEGAAGSWGIGSWGIDAVNVVWALVSAYFATAAVACVVGAFGVLRRLPVYVRFYRDYSVADLCFCAVTTVLFALASFRPTIRSTVCDQLAKQPELLRDLAEAGLNLENCEQWFEHAVVALVGITAVLLVVRLQFIITVSNYYKRLLRDRTYTSLELSPASSSSSFDDNSVDPRPQRLFLLPNRPSVVSPIASSSSSSSSSRPTGRSSIDKSRHNNNVLVYAPVPLSSLTEEEAKHLDAREAWVSSVRPGHHHGHRTHGHGHHRRHDSHHGYHAHSHSNSSSHGSGSHHHRSHARRHSLQPVPSSSALLFDEESGDEEELRGGSIKLPIREGEGLLPPYDELELEDVGDSSRGIAAVDVAQGGAAGASAQSAFGASGASAAMTRPRDLEAGVPPHPSRIARSQGKK